MKNRNILLTAMLFVVASAIAPTIKAAQACDCGPSFIEPEVTIHSTDNVTRGNIGTFVLNMKSARKLRGMYVKFSVSGTAVQGADYVMAVSPAYIGKSGYAVIQIQTFPDPRDPRESSSHQVYSVVLTLVDGPGYTVGESSSATMLIKPLP